MSVDLFVLWAERDRARAAWQAFLKREFDLSVLNIPFAQRTAEQQQMIDSDEECRAVLLSALYAAERKIRVATGHENPDISSPSDRKQVIS